MLLALVAALKAGGRPITVFETHAGAGAYDLFGKEAQASREAERGVFALMADPATPSGFDALKATVERANGAAQTSVYPGSPLLMIEALGKSDRYTGCELRPDDHASLATLLVERRRQDGPAAMALLQDGYTALETSIAHPTLVVIDPPFERGDEYDQVVGAARTALNFGSAVAIWAPIKDLETLDLLISRLKALRPKTLVAAQVRLRRLANPMKMNGCVMILLDALDVREAMAAMATWTAKQCGEAGAQAILSTT